MIFKPQIILFFICLMFSLNTTDSAAQTDVQSNANKDPIEITADKSLEWHRNDQLFIARVNARAKQGDIAIDAQTLEAKYAQTPTSSMDIYEMTADENVVISSRESQAFGEHAVYDLKSGIATMTGGNLKLISPDQTLTARDRFEYHVEAGKMYAYGDAKIIRPKLDGTKDIIEADKVSSTFINNERGERVLKETDATGNVVITTPTEIITGAYGIYHANTNEADITGGVTITRGPNILEGERAKVNLNTNTSRLFGGKGKKDGRVRGVFYPGSENSEE